MAARASIFGCEGLAVTSWERDFFARADPLGFILFARNCETPAQVRALVADLRDCVGRPDAPVLIDQEGGRVTRLKPPHWRAAPAPARFGEIAPVDRDRACAAAELNARLLAAEVLDLGISVDCVPLLDLRIAGADAIIGDRAFSTDADLVADLGRAVCDGMLAGGVLPVVKHMPGHGRALVDSHHALPVVDTPRGELEATDFRPFAALADAPWGMTAHVVYSAIDPQAPATTSRRVIDEVIRGFIGFDGVLVSDDLSMQALQGGLAERATNALAAGCDIALHCNGKAAEMTAVADAVPELTAEAQRRLTAATARLGQPPAVEMQAMQAQLDSLMAG
ncbi:MAG: beta-N-acetylhexosaminidase [Alphaproteobacteria bacterium]